MNDFEIMSIIESILFAWSDPVYLDDLSKVLDLDRKKIVEIMDLLKEKYKKEDSGLRLMEVEKSYQISTKPKNYDYISKFVTDKNKKNLSNASLETLAIIAYKQPVTKLEIEEIRGVKCDYILRSLLEMDLIRISGQVDKIGRPNLYSTTNEFLKKIGVSSINDLPKIEEISSEEQLNFMEEK